MGTLVFTPENDYATMNVSIAVASDGLMEGTEYFHLAVTPSAVFGTWGAVRVPTTRVEASIAANAAVLATIEGPAAALAEGATATFVITRSGASPQASVVSFTVTRSASFAADELRLVAAPGTSYTPATARGRIELPAGADVTATLAFVIEDDAIAEPMESFSVRLQSISGLGVIGNPAEASVSILASDPLTVELSVLPANARPDGFREFVYAGSPPAFRIRLLDAAGMPSEPSAPVVISYSLSGTATGGTATETTRDYTWPVEYDTASETGAARIPNTGSSSSVQVVVVVINDSLNEPSEKVAIELLEVTAGGSLVVWPPTTTNTEFTIVDDDPIAYGVVVDPARVTEDASSQATFTLELRGAGAMNPPRASAGDVELPYTMLGSATYGDDYTSARADSGTIRLAAGETSASFAVTVLDDESNESTETITLSLGEPPTLGAGTGIVSRSATQVLATVAIERNDAVTYSVASLASSVREGEDAEFLVRLDGGVASAPITLTYTVASSDPNPGGTADFAGPATGEVGIAAGESSTTLTIGIEQDARAEAAETLTVRLTAVMVGAGGGIVVAGTASAVVEIAVNAATVRTFHLTTRTHVAGAAEGDTVGYLVTLDGAAPNAAVDVAWSIAGVGANPTETEDFVAPLGGTVRFTPQDTSGSTKGFVVEIAHDTLNEGDESYRASLAMPDADSSVSGTPVVTIADDVDDRIALSIGRIDAGDLSEGAASADDRRAEFRVSVENATATAPITFSLTVGGDGITADDYSGVMDGASLSISVPNTSLTLTLEAADDDVNEGDETLIIALGADVRSAGAAGLTSKADMTTAAVTISRNDATLVSVAGTSESVGVAEGSSAVFALRLAGGEAASPITVEWRVATSAAVGGTSDGDFERTSGTFEFALGTTTGTVHVPIRDDGVTEALETYRVVLSAARGGGGAGASVDAASSSATGTILAGDPLTVVLVRDDPALLETQLREETAATFAVELRPPGSRAAGAITATWSAAVVSQTNTGRVDTPRMANTPENPDVMPVSGAARIEAGATRAAFMIEAHQDGAEEDVEIFTVRLGAVDAAPGAGVVTLGSQTTAQATIEANSAATRFLSVRSLAEVTTEGESTQAVFVVLYRGDSPDVDEGGRLIPVQVDWRLVGDAEAGTDYPAIMTTPTLRFTAVGSQTVSVQLTDDSLNEARERLVFEITDTVGGFPKPAVTTPRATVWIADNDPIVAAVARRQASRDEGQDFSFTATLSGGLRTGPVTVPYRITGVGADPAEAADWSDRSGGSIEIAADATTGLITVRALLDDDAEGAEGLRVTLGTPTGAGVVGAAQVDGTAASASVEINPSVQINRAFAVSGPATVAEGTTATYRVTFTVNGGRTARPNTFTVTVAGVTATGDDFVGGGVPTIADVVFAGEGTGAAKSFDVGILDDDLSEGAETWRVVIAAAAGAPVISVDTVETEIAANDPMEAGLALLGAASRDEGAAGATTRVSFVVSLTPAPNVPGDDVVIHYALSGAVAADDYGDDTGGSVTMAAGQTTTRIRISIVGDDRHEPDEELVVALQSAQGANVSVSASSRAAVTIVNDDPVPTVSFALAGPREAAENTTATYVVTFTDSEGRAAPSTSIDIEVVAGAGVGTGDADFDGTGLPRRTLAFNGEASGSTRGFLVKIVADELSESTESYVVRIAGISVAADNVVTTTIARSDPLTVVLSRTAPAGAARLQENAAATFAVELRPSGHLAADVVTVEWSAAVDAQANTGGGANDPGHPDLAPASGVARIAAGDSSATFTVTARQDGIAEGEETFTVGLGAVGAGAGAGVVTSGAATTVQTTIAANLSATRFVSVRAQTAATTEGESTQAVFVVALSGEAPAPGETLSVDWGLAGEAEAGADYVAASTPALRFTATGSQTVSVRLNDDDLNEGRERLIFEITGASGGGFPTPMVTTSRATAWIADNDTALYSIGAVAGAFVGAAEGGAPPTLRASLDRASAGDIRIPYAMADGSAVGGADYRGAAGTVVISAGRTTTDFSPVAIIDDNRNEPTETLFVVLGAAPVAPFDPRAGAAAPATNPPPRAEVRISDDDTARYSIAALSPNVDEGAAADFEVRLGVVANAPITLTYTVAGSAPNPPDARSADFRDPGAGRVVVAAGSSRARVAIDVARDGRAEGAETLTVRLTGSAGTCAACGAVAAGAPLAAQVTIPANAAAVRTFAVVAQPGLRVAEGADVSYDVVLEGVAADAAVRVTWSAVGAGAGNPAEAADFAAVTGAVTFAAGAANGSTRAFTLSIAEDTLNEGDEQYEIRLETDDVDSAVAAPRFRTTIEDDADDRIVLSIVRVDSGDLSEEATDAADRRAEFRIQASNSTATAVITFALTITGSGVTSADYGGVASGRRYSIGVPSTRIVVTLEASDDNLNEGAETLRLALRDDARSAGAVSPAAPPRNAATVVIARSDPTMVSLERTGASDVGESDVARFAVRVSGGRSALPVALGWRVVTGTGAGRASNEDFGNLDGELEIAAGRTRGEIGVMLLEDFAHEPDERYRVLLENPRGGGGAGVVIGVSSVTAIIRQLDRTPPMLEGVAYAPGQMRVYLKSVGDEPLGILAPADARLPDVLADDGAAVDGFTLWTMTGGEREMIGVVGASYRAPHAVLLELAREITEDDGSALFADYMYPGEGLGIFDRALEAGDADARFGRNQLVSQTITIQLSVVSDTDNDCYPDAAEARLGLDPLAPPTPAQRAEIPRVILDRGVGGVAYVAYSAMRREGVAAHLGMETTGAMPVTLTAYYLSDTFGYSGAYPMGGYGCSGLFPADGYQKDVAAGGCAEVDFTNMRTGVEHRIGWLAKGASGYWHVTTGSGTATVSCLPEQRVRRVREVHMR